MPPQEQAAYSLLKNDALEKSRRESVDSVDDGTSSESTILDQERSAGGHRPRSRNLLLYGLTIVNIAVLVVTLSALSMYGNVSSGLNANIKKSSLYSPILDKVELPLSTWTFNGSFFADEKPGIARVEPGVEPGVDAEWAVFDHLPLPVLINSEEVRKIGQDPEMVVKMPLSYGYGDDAYPASIDVFHHIHCLNALRKMVYEEYQESLQPEPKNTWPTYRSEFMREHIGHCIDQVFQMLKCNANVDLITFNWMETQPNPYPNMFVKHQCRDFDHLKEWTLANRVPLEVWETLTKQEGAIEIPVDGGERYFKLYPENRPS